MTPQGMYQMLMEANASTACEAFDGHVLACIFAAGAGETHHGETFDRWPGNQRRGAALRDPTILSRRADGV